MTGDKPTAETDYRQAVSIDPKFALALYNLAIVRNSVGDTTSAITFYRQAIAADPNNPAPHFNLGLVLRAHREEGRGRHPDQPGDPAEPGARVAGALRHGPGPGRHGSVACAGWGSVSQ